MSDQLFGDYSIGANSIGCNDEHDGWQVVLELHRNQRSAHVWLGVARKIYYYGEYILTHKYYGTLTFFVAATLESQVE